VTVDYTKTTAYECRYGEMAAPLFEGCWVLWENSENDYQGHAKVLASAPGGTYRFVEWTYGSCSGCDEWEDRGLSAADITTELRRTMAVFDRTSLRAYAEGLAKEHSRYWESDAWLHTKTLHDAILKEVA
jgi:hypothetical protein